MKKYLLLTILFDHTLVPYNRKFNEDKLKNKQNRFH